MGEYFIPNNNSMGVLRAFWNYRCQEVSENTFQNLNII